MWKEAMLAYVKGSSRNLLEIRGKTMKYTIRITSPQPNHETDITVKPYHYVKPLRIKRVQRAALSQAKLVDCEI
jgi:hypothetical protein